MTKNKCNRYFNELLTRCSMQPSPAGAETPGSFPVPKHLVFLGGWGGGRSTAAALEVFPANWGRGRGRWGEYVNKSLGRQAILPKVSGSPLQHHQGLPLGHWKEG